MVASLQGESAEQAVHPIFDEILSRYAPREFPALWRQALRWEKERPLEGLEILDCAPVFRNTLAKHAALLCAGARLSVHVGRVMPCDPAIVGLLPRFGVRVLPGALCEGTFDCVSDCAGDHSYVASRLGYAELTRSGGAAYRDAGKPVFWSDRSELKEIETGLGTGDGFRRAMASLGLGDFKGREVVLFGSGKVGYGVAMRLAADGAVLTVVEDTRRVPRAPFGARLLDMGDKEAIGAAVREAACVVTATGVRHALAGLVDPGTLAGSGALLVNLGVEDEYGDDIPAERVLNAKKPVNFILDEPTRLRYIDPTMALQNEGLLYLATHPGLPAGLFTPPEPMVRAILGVVREEGLIARELNSFFAGRRARRPRKDAISP